jgi:hypothetical protein
VDPHSRSLTGGIAFTLADGHDTGIAIRIHIKPVVSRLLNGECHIGSVDFVDFSAKQMADMQVQCSLVEFYLHGIVADVGQREARLRTHAHDAGADVQFGARIFVCPHVVGNRQRTIQSSRNPIFCATWLNGNRPRHVLQTHSPPGNILLVLLAIRWGR